MMAPMLESWLSCFIRVVVWASSEALSCTTSSICLPRMPPFAFITLAATLRPLRTAVPYRALPPVSISITPTLTVAAAVGAVAGGTAVGAGGAAAEGGAPAELHPASSALVRSSAAARVRIPGLIMRVLSLAGLGPDTVSGIRYAIRGRRRRHEDNCTECTRPNLGT